MSSPVPVLFLLPALPVGGAERQIASLVRGLDRTRFRPHVACQHALGPVAEEIRAAGVEPELLSGSSRVDPAFLANTRRLLKRERIRILVTHGFSTGVVGRLAAVLQRVPVRILAEHSTGERDMTAGRHRINRWLNARTSAWIAVAHGQVPYLVETKRIPPDRIHVIPNGIDVDAIAAAASASARDEVRAEFGIPPEAPVAGMIAVLRPEKDPKTFLLAARFVLDALPRAHFILAGDGPLLDDMRQEARVLNMEAHVHLPGRRADVPRILAALDASVLSSTDVETMPLAFLESMAAGLPLIGTRVGGLPELVTEGGNGSLVEPRDPRGLADAMERVLGDAALRDRWGAASRE
ncbi:MAG: glycosyltransferase, partial [Gemmatimonadetes bacterium]|nr:glycosyltransferase [Gemmatimonadota bacterium]